MNAVTRQSEVSTMSKSQLLAELEQHLSGMLRLQAQGSSGNQISWARGRVDGFVRALLAVGIASEADVLQVIREARRGSGGPATGPIVFDESNADGPRQA